MAELSSLDPAQTVHNIKHIIPLTLDLQLIQYIAWAEVFQVAARARNAMHHIADPETFSPDPDVSADNWNQLDAVVLSWIYGSVSEDLLLTIIQPGSTARDVWLCVRNMFYDTKIARAAELQEQIIYTNLEDYPSVDAYIEQVKSLEDELKYIDELINPISNQETGMDEADFELSPIGRQMYIAAIQDEWDSVSHIFNEDATKFSAKISTREETALCIAVGTNRSHSFVEKAVEQIMICGGGVDMLRAPNWPSKETVLHTAARLGNARAAKLLVSKDPEMPQIVSNYGDTPLMLAAWSKDAKMLHYLLSVTRDEGGEGINSLFRGHAGADLLTISIYSGHYDVALYLIEKYPNLVWEKNTNGEMALKSLATKPNAFLSGNKLGVCQRIIYSAMTVNNKSLKYNPTVEGSNSSPEAGATNNLLLRSFLAVPYIKKIHDMKLRNMQAVRLVELMCDELLTITDSTKVLDIMGPAIGRATSHGCHELVEECVRRNPQLIWYPDEGYTFFGIAIKYRQEKVFNLIYQMSAIKMIALNDQKDGNGLNVVVELPPYHRLTSVTGAALQLQRELLWFKEVEKLSDISAMEFVIDAQWTARKAFTDAHKQLLKDAQEWTNNTASSSTFVAALIITMTFAALFTVPGGNNDEGKSLFLQDKTFLLFVLSDAIALFSSVASVLMFLSTMTHSSLDDFIYALPLRLTLGLLSLFISLAATMAAFSATLVIVLRDRVQWIVIPVTLFACFPAVLFLLLQYPILHELIQATFGKSIFYKQKDVLLH